MGSARLTNSPRANRMIKLEINREMRAPFKGYRYAYPWSSVAAPAYSVSTSVQMS